MKIKTKAQRRLFLEAYAETGVVTYAAKVAGVQRRRHYVWLAKDPEYAQQFEEVRQQAIETLLLEARRRAVKGTAEPVYYQGQQCGTIQRYSDVLLIFLLKGFQPETFRERYENRLTGIDGGPLRIVEEIVLQPSGIG